MKNQVVNQKVHKHYFLRIVLLFMLIFITVSGITVAQKCSSLKDEAAIKTLQKNIADYAQNGKFEELKANIEKDTKLANLKLEYDETALTLASYYGHLDIVKYLLTKEVDIESKNTWNNNALLNAAQTGYCEIGELLINKGANLEVQGLDDLTPLQFSLLNNQAKFAILLINKGAKVNGIDKWGIPNIVRASWYGNPGVIKAMAEHGGDINYADTDNQSILHNVCDNGNKESIDFLIKKGVNVNIANSDGKLPLHIAASNKNSEAVKLLVNKTINLNLKEKYFGNSALHIAAINGDIKSTQYLIDAGADVNVTNNDGLKPVECAVKYGYVKLIDFYSSKYPEYNKYVTQAKLIESSTNDKLNANELKIWYTGHSGWALQFKDKFIILDYWQQGQKVNEASFANGNITADMLKGKKVYVFATHNHSDHYDTTIFSWKKETKDIKYIYGFRPNKTWDNKELAYYGPNYKYITDNQTTMVDDIKITTIKSDDSGQGFLLEVNGMKIFHPGDHAMFNADIEADYKREIEFIAKQTEGIDIAFIPVTGCPISWKKEKIAEGFLYILDKLNPIEVFPMHAFQREHLLNDFAKIAEDKKYKNKVICVQNKGDHYTYSKSETASK